MEQNESQNPVFEAYESEEDVLRGELSFDGEFSRERIGFAKKPVIALLIAAVVVLLAVVALLAFFPTGVGAHPIINEVMTSNDEAYLHPTYGSVDWIELYNPTDETINLSGYGLTDDIKKQYKYTFPESTLLEPGAYLVLYCTGGTNASDADPYCTGFALSQEGEQLFLLDRAYRELDELTVPYLETDTAYARTDSGAFAVTTIVTPGAANAFAEE